MIAFDVRIVDMLSNKRLNPVVTELFIRGRKYISGFCYTILFCCPKILIILISITLFYGENSKETTASTNRI